MQPLQAASRDGPPATLGIYPASTVLFCSPTCLNVSAGAVSPASLVLGGLWEELHGGLDCNDITRSNHRHALWWQDLHAEEQVATSLFGAVTRSSSAKEIRHFCQKNSQSTVQISLFVSTEAGNYRSILLVVLRDVVQQWTCQC